MLDPLEAAAGAEAGAAGADTALGAERCSAARCADWLGPFAGAGAGETQPHTPIKTTASARVWTEWAEANRLNSFASQWELGSMDAR